MCLESNEYVVLEYRWKIDISDVKIKKFLSEPVTFNSKNFLQFAIYKNDNYHVTPQFTVLDMNLQCIRVKFAYFSFDGSLYSPLELKSGERWNLFFASKESIDVLEPKKSILFNYKILMENSVDKFIFELIDNNFLEDLWAAASSSTNTDVEFQIGSSVIAAHRVVLAARSATFAKYLAKYPTEKQIVVQDANLDPETYKVLIQFLYTGQLKTVPTKDLLILAQKYQISTLESICSDAFNFDKFAEFKNILSASASGSYCEEQHIKTNAGTVNLFKKGVIIPSSPEVKITQKHGVSKVSIPAEGKIHLPVAYVKTLDGNISKMATECQVQWLTVASCRSADELHPSHLMIELDETAGNWSHQLVDGRLAAHLWSSVASHKQWTDFGFHFATEDRVFAAHRWILSARSSVFAKMFSSKTKQEPLGRIDIDDIKGDVFEELLYFLYTGHLMKDRRNDPSFIQELLMLADKYQVDTLKIVCQGMAAPSDDDLYQLYQTAHLSFC